MQTKLIRKVNLNQTLLLKSYLKKKRRTQTAKLEEQRRK